MSGEHNIYKYWSDTSADAFSQTFAAPCYSDVMSKLTLAYAHAIPMLCPCYSHVMQMLPACFANASFLVCQ